MFRLADKWRRHDIEALGECGERLKIMARTARCINCSQCIGQCPICGDSGLLKKKSVQGFSLIVEDTGICIPAEGEDLRQKLWEKHRIGPLSDKQDPLNHRNPDPGERDCR